MKLQQHDKLKLKNLTTTQRDALTSVAGDMIFNTTTSKAQVYNGSSWSDLGGIAGEEIEFLVVGGGGRGGRGKDAYRAGGGGGAGGYVTSVTGDSTPNGDPVHSNQIIQTGTNYNVTVGAGTGSYSTRGGDSNFHQNYAIGGGGSWGYQHVGAGGGSGGGNGDSYINDHIESQGNRSNGASGSSTTLRRMGGGGAGESGGTDGTGTGGDGLITTIITSTEATTYSVGQVDGTDVYFAGGGSGGGAQSSGGNIVGGLGGGGTGVTGNGSNGTAGTVNTGGGGGGAGNNGGATTGNGGSGGSGVVILRYPSSLSITVGAGLTSSTFTQGSNSVTIFTAGTDNISWS